MMSGRLVRRTSRRMTPRRRGRRRAGRQHRGLRPRAAFEGGDRLLRALAVQPAALQQLGPADHRRRRRAQLVRQRGEEIVLRPVRAVGGRARRLLAQQQRAALLFGRATLRDVAERPDRSRRSARPRRGCTRASPRSGTLVPSLRTSMYSPSTPSPTTGSRPSGRDCCRRNTSSTGRPSRGRFGPSRQALRRRVHERDAASAFVSRTASAVLRNAELVRPRQRMLGAAFAKVIDASPQSQTGDEDHRERDHQRLQRRQSRAPRRRGAIPRTTSPTQ